jgi:hypothetical protein
MVPRCCNVHRCPVTPRGRELGGGKRGTPHSAVSQSSGWGMEVESRCRDMRAEELGAQDWLRCRRCQVGTPYDGDDLWGLENASLTSIKVARRTLYVPRYILTLLIAFSWGIGVYWSVWNSSAIPLSAFRFPRFFKQNRISYLNAPPLTLHIQVVDVVPNYLTSLPAKMVFFFFFQEDKHTSTGPGTK